MSAVNALDQPTRGDLASTSVQQLLSTLEAQRLTGRVRFDTEVGQGEVDFVAGAIVHARMIDLVNRAALFRLLGIVDGSYEVSQEPIEAQPAIADNVEQLLEDRGRRQLEWRRLSERAPAFSSVYRLSEDGRAAMQDSARSAEERALLRLADGGLTIADLIDASGLDAVDALGLIVQAIEKRSLIEDAGAKFEVVKEPAASFPRAGGAAEPPPAGGFIASRKSTVIGLGVPDVLAPVPSNGAPAGNGGGGAEVRRIISVVSSGDARSSSAPPPGEGVSNVADAGAAGAPSFDPLSTAADVNARGKYVGRYEILCRIGHGGMGSVFLCRLHSEVGFRRLFALKLLRQHLMQNSEAARNFLEEARLAGQLHHPNVVSVLDAGLHGAQPFLVMDYIEGGSLKQLLTAHADARPPELILPIIMDALAGLEATHTLVADDGTPLDIVHCDVSPENLLVGIDGVCRLTDFGVAQRAAGPTGREGTRGKPSYLAPEQIMGGRIDRRADLFSLGVVLYNALTGTRLFDAPTIEQSLQLVCTQRLPPPSTVGLRPPPSLDFVCMRALERDPERRFQSAQEMLLELRRIAIRENLMASTAEVAGWVRESVGRELAQRRLTVLDASRKSRPASELVPATLVLPQSPAAQASGPPAAARAVPSSEPPTGSEPPASERVSQTMFLPGGAAGMPTGRRWGLIVASTLALLAVLVTLVWPTWVSKLFRLKADSIVVDGLQGRLDAGALNAPAGSASVTPEAPSATPPAASGAPLHP